MKCYLKIFKGNMFREKLLIVSIKKLSETPISYNSLKKNIKYFKLNELAIRNLATVCNTGKMWNFNKMSTCANSSISRNVFKRTQFSFTISI